MKKNFSAIVFAACLILISCNSNKGDAITLKFNLPKGSGYDYSIEMNMTMQGKANGSEVNMKNDMSMRYLFGVTGDSAGWKKLTANITRIAMDVNAGGRNISFDSDKPGDTSGLGSTLSRLLGAMKGEEFSFTMNEKGDIGQVTGIREMMQRVSSSIHGEDGGIMNPVVSGIFNEENFKQNIQQSFSAYPEKPVRPGDKWAKSVVLDNQAIPMKMDNSYTLESVSGNTADIKVNSKISPPGGSTDMIVTGSMEGTMQYDVPTGVPVKGDLEMKIKMTMNSGVQSVPMNTNIKIKITGQKS